MTQSQKPMTEHTSAQKTRRRGTSPPRLNVQLRDNQQFDTLNHYIPSGMKRRVFLAIVDNLIELFEMSGEAGKTPAQIMADVVDGNLSLQYGER